MSSWIWISAYGILLIVNLAGNLTQSDFLANVSKVFLMPMLIGLVLMSIPREYSQIFKITILALVLSWIGDVLLIFQASGSKFFLFGLGAFLFAQLFYFLDYRLARFKDTVSNINWWEWTIVLFLFGFYLAFLFIRIGPGLNEFLIPVIIYAITISAMFLAAFSRRGRTGKWSFILVWAGAGLFVFSDSLIAMNKFGEPIDYASTLIMLTYGTAQYLIIRGLILHVKN